MGMYKYIRDVWKKQKLGDLKELNKQRLIEWRQEPVTVRILRPTRLDKARSLGYKAKPGIILARQRVGKSARMREKFASGRKSSHMRRKKIVGKSYQQIAEERTSNKFPNCEVLNSYKVAEDGKNHWFEVIMVDKYHPQTIANKKLNWVTNSTGRAERGITSAGRKSRGLRNKGIGAEKIGPSRRANNRRH